MPLQSSISAPLSPTGKHGVAVSNLIAGIQQQRPQEYTAWQAIQNALNAIVNQLRTDLKLNELEVFDPQGNRIGWIGDTIFGDTAYVGAAFQNLWVGPNADPSTAKLMADSSGNLTITNAHISVTGTSGLSTTVVTLQPNGVGIEVQTTVSGLAETAVLSGANLVFTNSLNGQKASFLGPQVNLWDGGGNIAAIMDASAGLYGTLKIFNAGSQVIELDGNSQTITATTSTVTTANATTVNATNVNASSTVTATTSLVSNGTLTVSGIVNTSFGAYQVGGQQVVGTRKPAISAPSGGTTIDTQARNAILAIINTLSISAGGHGLTA